MHPVLSDYLSIFRDYPQSRGLTKAEKKSRHSRLQKWLAKEEKIALPSAKEMALFLADYKNEILLNSVFYKKMRPAVIEDIMSGQTTALKMIIGDEASQSAWVQANDRYSHGQDFTLFKLCQKLLSMEPDYLPALELKFRIWFRAFDYDIHEVPWGVLISKSEIPAALIALAEFEELSLRLGKDCGEFVKSVRFYYDAWEDYLEHYRKDHTFASYIEAIGKRKFTKGTYL